MSPSHDEIHWPPRSSHEVLLSTPGGRNRLRKFTDLGSPSPSPTKRSTLSADMNETTNSDIENLDDDDEEEEILQLQLQEIQARLRLKKLRKKNTLSSNPDPKNLVSESVSQQKKLRPNISGSSQYFGLQEHKSKVLTSQAPVDVPVSPIRRRVKSPDSQRSPGRVRLGIDKGLKGSDVSLKRVPSFRNQGTASNSTSTGSFLRRCEVQSSEDPSISSISKPKSFSERLAAVRNQDIESQRRESRLKKSRSTAFEIDRNQMQTFKENAIEFSDLPRQAPEFSRDEVLTSLHKSNGVSSRNKTFSDSFSAVGTSRMPPKSLEYPSNVAHRKAKVSPPLQPSEKKTTESEVSQFEPYSSQHLTKRIIPHQRLTRALAGKKAYHIPDLLREVKPPEFSAPDVEEDLVVLGIIASKSDPKLHQQTSKNQNRRKFMVMTLTDLKWELDLFLFDSAFEKFWKMTPGTIIAILNPLFMPPPKGKIETNKFSLTLNSDADTVLEIGTARDLGFCKSVKRDGKLCNSWIDKRHTEFCDFHVNASLKKTHAARMEVNTMTFGKSKYATGWRKDSHDHAASFPSYGPATKDPATRYDRESHSHIFIGRRNAANLLDDVDFDPDHFHRGSSKEERITRRLLSQERERKLEHKLATLGSGLASDYARIRLASSNVTRLLSAPIAAEKTPSNAVKLGLRDKSIKDVALSPIKRKRTDTLSGASSRGWGMYPLKDLTGDDLGLAPAKKKTRFVTEKGIREAGRESLNTEMMEAVTFDDSDDDLDIVRG